MKQKIVSGFVNPGNDYLPDYVVPSSYEEDVVELENVQVVKKIGEGDTDFILSNQFVEKSRVSRQELINSFRDDVGILNILKKVSLTGDESLFNQRKPQTDFVDISEMPDFIGDAMNITDKAHQDYANLDPDLTKGQSFKDFIANMDQEKFDAYIAEKVAAMTAGGSKNE